MLKRRTAYPILTTAFLLSAGPSVVAGDGKSSPETDLAAPGAPLYEKAVKESVVGLKSKQEQAKLGAQSRPPSPGPDYYWCENCKTYHKRKTQPSAQKPASTPKQDPAPAVSPQPAATRPPSPGPGYYWCEHCKTYHRKKTPAASAQTNTVTAASPPSPGADYYWCEHCQSYHKRKISASAQIHTPPPAAARAAQSPGENYYYCEKCKTYHLRKAMDQESVENLIIGGATNKPHQHPHISP
jgi:hypothetical protein